MIVIEGPDGAGKTTLIKELVGEYRFKVGERGTKDRDLLYTVTVPDTMRAIRKMLAARQGGWDPVIWDRLYYSDLVYAPIQGREVAFSREERRFVEFTLRELQVPVILCLPPWDIVQRNVLDENRHEMPKVKQNIDRIYRAYRHGMAGRWYTFHYDYTLGDLHRQELLTHINNYLELRRKRTWSLAPGQR